MERGAISIVISVSIRSPRRNEGRLTMRQFIIKTTLFQSAPPVETRGDSYWR